MIQSVSMTNSRVSFSQDKKSKLSDNIKSGKMAPYVDSFVKNSIESTPMLLAVSGGWTAYDIIFQKNTVSKSLARNFLGFFLPVMLVSSSILSVVENKKPSKRTN